MDISFLRRNIFHSLHGLRSKSPMLSYWRKLENTQYYSRKKLEEIQWKRLTQLWHFLWKNNIFYQKRFKNNGLNKNSLSNPSDIQKIPFLTKKDIRANLDAMISKGYRKDHLMHFKTGGSTGKALDIYITEECSELRNACARRHDRWSGWKPGQPIGAVWGNPKLPKTLKEKILDRFVQPFIYLDTMAVTDKSVSKFASDWKRIKPTLLFGHAHSLFILSQHIKRLGIETIRPTGIISTSMMLLPHERKSIEAVFKTKVTDRYGCEEVSLIGCECEQQIGMMHMNIEHLVIEFIGEDGVPVKPGDAGYIVVTDLMNKAMPFVRYCVEDMGTYSNQSCSCGRGLPVMGKVTGRVADFLVKKNGDRVAGISLIENTLTKMPGIDQMQIIQNSLNEFVLNIVPGREFNQSVQSDLHHYFKTIFTGSSVSVNIIKEILPEPSGKYRFSICRIS